MDGYDAYCLYVGLKLHFSPGTYDFFKYQGKTRTTVVHYEQRKDRYFFHKLARKYNTRDDLAFFLAANFFHRKLSWIGTLLSEESHDLYLARKRVKESLDYVVREDCKKLELDNGPARFTKVMQVVDGSYPALVQASFQGDIHEETLAVIAAATGWWTRWKGTVTDTIIFPAYQHQCERYLPFLETDLHKIRHMLKLLLTSDTK
jgi:hypothetical protein